MGHFDLLTFPVLGPAKMVHWLAKTISDEALREYTDEGRVKGALLEIQQKLDAGELTESEYDLQERELMEHLNSIRELKEKLANDRT